MKRSHLVLAVAAVSALFQSLPAAAWSFTTTGVVGAGYDRFGTFIEGASPDLSGLAFTLTTIVDPSAFSYENSDSYLRSGYGGSVPFSTTLTLNGITKTFMAVNQYGSFYLQDALSKGIVGRDGVGQLLSGYAGDGTMIYANQSIYSTANSLGLDLSYDQAWSYEPRVQDDWQGAVLQITGPSDNLFFRVSAQYGYSRTGYFTSVSLQPEGSGVPEPSGFALLSLSLVGLAAFRCANRIR